MRTGDDDLRIASLPRAESAVIAGAGHMMHWTHPRETAERLLAFLTQQG
jgi:pimeloyl-ACP methyl ester carboxylesterase